jgi:hypothetical protein
MESPGKVKETETNSDLLFYDQLFEKITTQKQNLQDPKLETSSTLTGSEGKSDSRFVSFYLN